MKEGSDSCVLSGSQPTRTPTPRDAVESLPTPINSWRERFVAFFSTFFAGLARCEVTDAAQSYLEGLLRPLAAKNCWSIAEATGASDPQAHQRLLRTASWDETRLSHARRASVAETLGESDGVLIFDETGFLKSGNKSVGVGRQYSGTAGKIGNCQVAVFGAYTSSKGRTLYDTRLYLPKAWTNDQSRRREAGIPDSTEFATKAELAGQMLDQAVDEELPVGWVVADTVYGANFDLRQKLIEHKLQFVMEVPKDTTVYPDRPLILHASPARGSRGRGRPKRRRIKGKTTRVDAMADKFAPSTWKRIRVADGSKGPRIYDWAARRVVARDKKKGSQDLWLLVRRSVARPSEKAYYLAWAPAECPVATLAGVAANRWPIEECFKESKGEVGLADYQVRQWTPWHRHIELAMLAHLFLTQLRIEYGTDDPRGPLSLAETRRLYRIACRPERRGVEARYQWTRWRREHNQKARASHYRNRHRRSSKPK